MRIPKKTPKYNFRNNIGMIARSPSEAEYPNLWKGLTGWWSANVKSTPPKDGLKSLAYDPSYSTKIINLDYQAPSGSYSVVAGPRGWRVDLSGNYNGGGWKQTTQTAIGNPSTNDFTVMLACKLNSSVPENMQLYNLGSGTIILQYNPGGDGLKFTDYEDASYTANYSIPSDDQSCVLGHRNSDASEDKDHFVNGVRVGGRNGTYLSTTGNLVVGVDDGIYSDFWFDWFATWKRPLSDEEIWRLYSDVDYTPLTRKVTFPYRPISSQQIQPDGDITDGGWLTDLGGSDLYTAIDEDTASDSDYIESGNNPSLDVCEVTLQNPTTISPKASSGHTVSYRYQKSAAAGRDIELRVRLLDGTTEVASWTHSLIANGWTTATQTLSTAETSNITDWNDLRLEFRADVSGSGAGRRGQVSWAEMQVRGDPAPVSDEQPALFFGCNF